MNQLLSGLEGVLCLIDDVLIYGKDKEEHDSRLVIALERIQRAGITLNVNKCQFGKTVIKFLGYVIDKDGIHPDPEKTKGDEASSQCVRIEKIHGNDQPNGQVLTQLSRTLPASPRTSGKEQSMDMGTCPRSSFHETSSLAQLHCPYIIQKQKQRYLQMPPLMD